VIEKYPALDQAMADSVLVKLTRLEDKT